MSRNVMSQNLFCKTNKAFRLYLTKYFVSDLNPNNRIRVTRFQQPGTRFLNRVVSQLTTPQSACDNLGMRGIPVSEKYGGIKVAVLYTVGLLNTVRSILR